jgi:hypothetical protein
MKLFSLRIILIFSLALSMNAQALDGDSTECAHCSSSSPSNKILLLSSKFCAHFTGTGDKVAENIKNTLITYMKDYEEVVNPTSTQMIKLLNKNRNYMICGDDNINYMAESFKHGGSLGAFDQLFNVLFFDDFLLDDDSLHVNVNVITYSGPPTGSEPETVLDFMYRESKALILGQKERVTVY